MSIIYTRNNWVPCVRLKQWLAEAKRDNKDKSNVHMFLHSIQFVNIDEQPQERDYLIGLGVKSVPCMLEEETSYLGYEVIIEHLEEKMRAV